MDAVAVVLDDQLEGFSFLSGCRGETNLDGGCRLAVLDCVVEQVGDKQATVIFSDGDKAGIGCCNQYPHISQGGYGFKLSDGLEQAVGQIGDRPRSRVRGGVFLAGQGEHFGDNLFKAQGVGEATLQAGLVLLGGAALHAQQLQG